MKRIGIVILAALVFLSVLLLGALAEENSVGSAEPAAAEILPEENAAENAAAYEEAPVFDGDGEESGSNTDTETSIATDTDATHNDGDGADWYETPNGNKYYINTEGKAVVGFQPIGGHTYFFDNYGVMQTEWVTVGTGEYYFGDDGVMRTGMVEIDGRIYCFGDDGALIDFGITYQPENVMAAEGDPVVLTITASGDVDYQWEYSKNGGVSWTNCKSAGSDTDTFSFTMKEGLDGRLYRCRITLGSLTMTSDAAEIMLLAITAHPKDTNAAAGDRVTLTLAAVGNDLSYQWQYSVDDGFIWNDCRSAGYNTNTFSFTMKESLDGRLYRCVVTKGSVSMYSDAAMITLRTPLVITAQPQDVVGVPNAQAMLNVEAEGDGLRYQWQYSKNNGSTWTNCKSAGYNTDTFSFTITAGLNGRLYRCVVTDIGGSSEASEAACVTVFGITRQPQDAAAVSGEKVTLKVSAVGNDPTYQWEYSKDGGASWTPCKTGGYNKDTFSFTMKATLDGRQYRCVVTDGHRKVFSEAAEITLFGITGQPADVNAAAGTKAELTVQAVGDGLQYRWQLSRDGGETWNDCTSEGSDQASFSFKLKASFSGRQYRCVVTDADGRTATSAAATITVG